MNTGAERIPRLQTGRWVAGDCSSAKTRTDKEEQAGGGGRKRGFISDSWG